MGNNFNTRIEGTCIKHRIGKVAVKMYDKFGLALRVETVTNDVSFFNTTEGCNTGTAHGK
ncbi:MAG: hypothetical protein LLF92_07230 [Planctomycetaceae bacterium]|nr:hypothetical protein [Planctomycetaceae bacterium]